MKTLNDKAATRLLNDLELQLQKKGGTMVGVCIYSKERFRPRVPGWEIERKTKKRGTPYGTLYGTYYASDNHIQTFIDYVFSEPRYAAKIIKFHQYTPKNDEHKEAISYLADQHGDPNNPKNWKYGIMVISTGPFEEEFEDWEIVSPPYRIRGLNLFRTQYRSKEPDWDGFKEMIEDDKELRGMVEYLVPELNTFDPQKVEFLKAVQKHLDRHRRNHVSITNGGGTRRTKYEYPTDCVTKKQRTRHRKMMRKLRKNGK